MGGGRWDSVIGGNVIVWKVGLCDRWECDSVGGGIV